MKGLFVMSCAVLALGLTGGALLACDGDPPVLTNEDGEAHPYELRCGAVLEKGSFKAKEKRVLKGKGGCFLKVGEIRERLSGEMECTIKKGKLSCDLL